MDCWKAVLVSEIGKEPEKGHHRATLMRWCGLGWAKSFSLPLFLIRSTHCRSQSSLTELCWKVIQCWGSVMSYSSEECLAFYGYFNWWQYPLLKVLNLRSCSILNTHPVPGLLSHPCQKLLPHHCPCSGIIWSGLVCVTPAQGKHWHISPEINTQAACPESMGSW